MPFNSFSSLIVTYLLKFKNPRKMYLYFYISINLYMYIEGDIFTKDIQFTMNKRKKDKK